jgi:hypothetical protein
MVVVSFATLSKIKNREKKKNRDSEQREDKKKKII